MAHILRIYHAQVSVPITDSAFDLLNKIQNDELVDPEDENNDASYGDRDTENAIVALFSNESGVELEDYSGWEVL